MVDAAAYEFADVEAMITRAEALFGPYVWERYDMLVLPPSFPYGGMENPRMTFLTPTVLAGDRSLVDVVAHELAHAWTGNLVTNATMEHFWLNEGLLRASGASPRRCTETMWRSVGP
jgi:aminopeptidase N